mgnify:CR=1 FL=1
MSQEKIASMQKDLSKIESDLAGIEEEASEQFQKWYQLHEERNTVIDRLRNEIRATPFEGRSNDYGTFQIRRFTQEVADISLIRREAPDVLKVPGVVSKLDLKALKAALEAEEITGDDAKVVKDSIEKREGTPRISGPKSVDL